MDRASASSARIGLPVAIGMVRPMIVLPDRFAESEPDDCLEAALAHEWAHIRNGDLSLAGVVAAAQRRALCSAPLLVAAT